MIRHCASCQNVLQSQQRQMVLKDLSAGICCSLLVTVRHHTHQTAVNLQSTWAEGWLSCMVLDSSHFLPLGWHTQHDPDWQCWRPLAASGCHCSVSHGAQPKVLIACSAVMLPTTAFPGGHCPKLLLKQACQCSYTSGVQIGVSVEVPPCSAFWVPGSVL